MTQKSSHGIQKRHSTYLPHWEQEGAFLFVTFRAADSLPQSAIEKLASERRELERRVARGDLNAGEDLARFNKLFSKRLEDLLDKCTGECLLRDERTAKIVADALLHFDGVRYLLLAWCIMPNHVHVILQQRAGWGLAKILQSWKTFTARKINELHGVNALALRRQPSLSRKNLQDQKK